MSETFKPDDKVVEGGNEYVVVHQEGKEVWIKNMLCNRIMPAVMLAAATDPNAEPEPQKCPSCDGGTEIDHGAGLIRYVRCEGECRMHGPLKPTRLEAIQAWNSIRIATALDVQKEFMVKESAAHAERLFAKPPIEKIRERFAAKPADSDPLTEEWLRKVGLDKFGLDHWRVLKRVTTAGDWWLDTSDRVYFIGTALKTIGDARQLCRLLGVPLKEQS